MADSSPYETIHSYLSNTVAPYFKSYIKRGNDSGKSTTGSGGSAATGSSADGSVSGSQTGGQASGSANAGSAEGVDLPHRVDLHLINLLFKWRRK